MVPPEWLPTNRAGPVAGTFSMPRTSDRKYVDSSGLSRGSVLAMCSGSHASKLSSPVARPAASPSIAAAIWSSPSTGAGERRARWTSGLCVGAMTCASPTPARRNPAHLPSGHAGARAVLEKRPGHRLLVPLGVAPERGQRPRPLQPHVQVVLEGVADTTVDLESRPGHAACGDGGGVLRV